MIRMTRLTDYGIVLLAYFARHHEGEVRSARDVAAESHLPLPTVSKVLKLLARKGLLTAQRGVKGGFKLARRPNEISVSEIITALERPIAITACTESAGLCDLEQLCPSRSTWRRVNQVVRDALGHITLAEIVHPTSSRTVAAAFRV
jgi:FeS assembly SUF system regulator